MLETVAELAIIGVAVAIGDQAAAVAATVAFRTLANVFAPLDTGTKVELIVSHVLVVEPLAREHIAVAQREHAATVAAAVLEVALEHLAVAIGELAEAVRVVALDAAVVTVAVLEQQLAVAGHAVVLPLAGVLARGRVSPATRAL